MLHRTSCITVEFKKIRESVDKFDSGPICFPRATPFFIMLIREASEKTAGSLCRKTLERASSASDMSLFRR